MKDPLEMRPSDVRVCHLIDALNDILVNESWADGISYIHIHFNLNGDYSYASLTKIQALVYLKWLRAGNKGTWEDYRHRDSKKQG